MRLALSLGLLGVVALLPACSPAPPAAATAAPAATEKAPAEIAWRHGDVDDAFAEARDSGKPVLLYWGAVWCPPCNQLKATLFKDPAFIALTRHYVPVYLDGDEEGAQAWGERFGVRGYPTLIVLDPQRNELTRLAGGNDSEALTRALTLAANRRTAIGDVLQVALTTPGKVSAEDWRVLGDYGWEVDANRLAGTRAPAALLRQLSQAAPDPALQRRFGLLALATRTGDKTALPAAERAQTKALLEAVISAPAEVRANRDLLGYQGASLVQQASADPAQARALGNKLLAALDAADHAQGDPADARLSSVLTEIALHEQQHPGQPLPEAVKAKARERVAQADAAATTPHERQATISTAVYVLRQSGDDAAAEKLLLAELDRSQTPYYYMPELAELAEARGDTPGALAWLHKAYQGAEGPATRVQWGVLYVEGLLRLTPDDAAAIETATGEVIAELSTQPAGYHQRTRQRFERLGTALQAWGREHQGASTLGRLQTRMSATCATAAPEGEGAASCARWLKS